MRDANKPTTSTTAASATPVSPASRPPRIARLPTIMSRLPAMRGPAYRYWTQRYDTLSDSDRAAIGAHIESFQRRPLISIVMPTYETPERLLREAIGSIRAQLYDNWELCVADDASPSPNVTRLLVEYAALDKRVRFMRRDTNGNIALASNSALKLATGEFVALMDHDDLLPAHALYEVAALIDQFPDADLVYSDEDKISDDGIRFEPYFKTDWNPELFLGHNMVSHFGVYRRALIETIGGFRAGFEGSQDYDLALRAAAATSASKIHHISSVLYHWRQSKGNRSFSNTQLDRCIRAARRAKADYLATRGVNARILQCETSPSWEEARRLPPDPTPLVTAIVPARPAPARLRACLQGLLWRTDYAPLQIIVSVPSTLDKATRETLRGFEADACVGVVESADARWPALVNAGAAQARGDILAIVDPDTEPRGIDWLTQLVALAVDEENGVIGPKLLHERDKLRGAGLVLGLNGVAAPAFRNWREREPGYYGRAVLCSNVSALSEACLVVRRKLFEDVGGMNARELGAAHANIDFCLRLAAKGKRNVWMPQAVLSHDHRSREAAIEAPGAAAMAAADAFMARHWGALLANDPYYNPNLSLTGSGFELAFPPRRHKPWAAYADGRPALAKRAASS